MPKAIYRFPKLVQISVLTALAVYALFQMESCQSQPYKQGEILYANFCANCHMEDGSGLEGNIPPLAGADYLKRDPAATACIIRYGLEDTIVVNGRTYSNPMAAIPQLSEFEIANIINYINHSWGNNFGFVRLDEIRSALEQCTSEK